MFLSVKQSGQNNIVHHQTFYMIKKWSFISWRGSCQLKLDEIYWKSSIKNIIKHALSHRPPGVICMLFCHQVRKHKKSQTQQQKRVFFCGVCLYLWFLTWWQYWHAWNPQQPLHLACTHLWDDHSKSCTDECTPKRPLEDCLFFHHKSVLYNESAQYNKRPPPCLSVFSVRLQCCTCKKDNTTSSD